MASSENSNMQKKEPERRELAKNRKNRFEFSSLRWNPSKIHSLKQRTDKFVNFK